MQANTTLQPTAFHHWLVIMTNGDEGEIARKLKNELHCNQNPQVFDLLEATGDKRYSSETFLRAAQLVKQLTAKQ